MAKVFVWGFGKLGQLGNGKFESSLVPIELKLSKNGDRPAAIYTGGLFTAVLTQKGDIFVCGCGKYGRLGTSTEDDIPNPTKIAPAKDAKVSQVAAGSWHTCAITYLGRLYSWGYNSKHNVLGRDCDKKCSLTPGIIPSLLYVKVKTVSCGHNFTLVCSTEGNVYSWGCGRYGVLGHGSENCVLEPEKVASLENVFITTVNAGYTHCGAVSEDGRLFMFGRGSDGALGFGPENLENKTEPTWLRAPGIIRRKIVDVSCSVGEHRGHTLALTADGDIFVWGSNHKGKLGLGDDEIRYTPIMIPSESFLGKPVRAISAGGIHSGAVTADGRVYTWGSGKDGRLGHAEMQNMPARASISYHSTRPKEVTGITEKLKKAEERIVATQISCSHYHTVVLLDYPPKENPEEEEE